MSRTKLCSHLAGRAFRLFNTKISPSQARCISLSKQVETLQSEVRSLQRVTGFISGIGGCAIGKYIAEMELRHERRLQHSSANGSTP